MLDLKNWFSPKHYKRLWNIGPPGLIASLLLIYLTLRYEAAFNLKKYEDSLKENLTEKIIEDLLLYLQSRV